MWHWHTFVTTTGGGLLQNKSKQGGILFFENPPEIFHFYNLLLEISDKTKLNPMMDIPQNCVSQLARSLGNSMAENKTKTPAIIPCYFFLVTIGNSTSFLTSTGNSTSHGISLIPLEILYPQPTPMFGYFLMGSPHWLIKRCVCVCVCVNVFVSVE